MTKLMQTVDDYLAMRRGLGFKLDREGSLLPEFVAYLHRHGSAFITTNLALAWATKPEGAASRWFAKRLVMVRVFAEYARTLDPRHEVPPADLLPYRSVRRPPYLYSDADVLALMDATQECRGPLMSQTYATLIGLLAVTGMRVGEAIALDRSDVNVDEKLLVFRDAKFGKSRELVLHPTTFDVLQAYGRRRDRMVRPQRCERFFVSQAGTPLFYSNVHWTFLKLVRRAGLWNRRPRRPRIHDLRHTFAVRTLVDWHRAGVDVAARLPRLSTYLGHVSPESTYYYLTAAPELVGSAALCLERTLGELP